MKEACRLFATGKLPANLQGLVPNIPSEITLVATAFIEIQSERHRADYDLTSAASFNRRETIDWVARVRQAFEAFERIRNEPAAELYLLALLFQPLGR